MIKTGCQLLTRWQSLTVQPSVRHMIAGRSRSETPQAVPDDWGTSKPLDKQSISTPIKRNEKRFGAPDEVKGKEIEVLWPTQREIEEGEFIKPQWERKQINHIWYGYDYNDKFRDEAKMKQRMFSLVSIGLFLFWFSWRYFPDRLLTHYCQREAYLRLALRESLGLPGVNCWYVDPAKIAPYLPSDEELGDMPIEI
ncbi:unnamed protein product [Adineta steineri]|uniref:NADH dehydrogenase [ubiquinone] 1 beta subcomplex subunit 11, mitochondrial n=1 Tax=Adineta steineri TaxID=433720 RepID=A0A814QFN7_9BILA|nr:unnamed protein product [Adineta steineri]CAF1119019.1 unnamed protein product [Adineta steineri]CAF3677883.1 unnamed protein product [Adineta steineri]CAF3992290.1 unnamed protein product [Adineta steineri]